jgi:hypothetical protein
VLIVLGPNGAEADGMPDEIDVGPLIKPDCVDTVVVNKPEVTCYRQNETERREGTKCLMAGMGLISFVGAGNAARQASQWPVRHQALDSFLPEAALQPVRSGTPRQL